MKVIGIVGSPRSNGNTRKLVELVLEGAAETGAETELVLLGEKDIQYCTSCFACKEGECPIQDDMVEIMEKVRAADVLVLGSPSYYDNVTGLMKSFIDRSNRLFHTQEMTGRRAVLVGVGSATAEKAVDALGSYCKYIGVDVVDKISANSQDDGDVSKNPGVLERCFEAGKV